MNMTQLDFSINAQDLQTSFAALADQLLNNHILISGDHKYRICEIEFYYKEVEGPNQDNYTHGHAFQKTAGQWYQHGSGLDITFGNENAFGGILIRALQELDAEGNEVNYIYGPLNSLQALMGSFGSVEKHEISFGLENAADNFLKHEKPIAAPRVGLNAQKQPDMYNKLYRYLILPQKKHAEKTRIYDSMAEQGYTDFERNRVWG